MVIYVLLGSTHLTVVSVRLPLIYHSLLTDAVQSLDQTQEKIAGTVNTALHELEDQKKDHKNKA